jgi:hypothetical protein
MRKVGIGWNLPRAKMEHSCVHSWSMSMEDRKCVVACVPVPHPPPGSVRRARRSVSRAARRELQRLEKLRIVTVAFGTGRQRMALERGAQLPNFHGVRVALDTGYHRVEGNRQASRNGRVSLSPTRNPHRYTISQRCPSLHEGRGCART